MTSRTVIAADLVLPMTGTGALRPGAVVIGRDGVIVDVDTSDSIIDRHGSVDRWYRGATLVPGLVDAHDHLHGWRRDPDAGSVEAVESSLAAIAEQEVRSHLSRGVTTVRVLGTPYRLDQTLRARLLASPDPGPRLLCAGVALMGAHGTSATGRRIAGPDAARRAVDEEVAAGADWIKVLASRGIDASDVGGALDDPQLDQETLDEIVRVARRHGVRVAAHAHGRRAIEACVGAGVDTIEHGTDLTDELAREMAADGICLVPTLSTYRRLVSQGASIGLPESWRTLAATMLEPHSRTTKGALDAGVVLAAGSDGFGDVIEEIEAMADLGLGPRGALEMADEGGRRIAGVERHGLREGAVADLLIVRGDLTADLAALRAVEAVMIGGRMAR